MASYKQKLVLSLFEKGQEMTKQQVIDSGVCGSYYYNAEKYVGEILSRMVKAGLLERTRQGVFRLPDAPPPRKQRKSEMGYENQRELF